MKEQNKPSLATGSSLTPKTWADFVARLLHDCVGEGVVQHHTADATFLVQRRVWCTVPEGCSDTLRVRTDDYDEPLEDFFKDLGPEDKAELDEALDGSFLEADAYDQSKALETYQPDSTLYHAQESWDFVCQHFTRDAADAFMRRKGHDYPEGLRVYVDATVFSWELNTIKAAILEGRIGYLEKETLRAGYDAARLEIESLKAQLEAVGAGGVGPLMAAPAQPVAPEDSAVFDFWRADHMPHSDKSEAWAEWCALRSNQPAPQPAARAPENIREGAPYDCPEFEEMARRMKVWGTAGSALCAQFWLGGMRRGKHCATQWPRDAAEVREFMASNCERTEYANASVTDDVAEYNACAPSDNDRYQLTAHDFLGAVDWWTDRDATAPSKPVDVVRVFWQQHTQSDALSMTMAELHNDVELVIRAALGAAQALYSVRVFWQQHTQAYALSMTMAELHDDVELVIRAARGQTLRLLTQEEMDSLGRRAEGMDGNEWDKWVQEKFAQVNGLKVQGGSYEWDWE